MRTGKRMEKRGDGREIKAIKGKKEDEKSERVKERMERKRK